MRKYLPLLTTVVAFAIECYLLDRLMELVDSDKGTSLEAMILLLIPIPLWLIIWYNFRQARHKSKRKMGRVSRLPFLLPFIRIVKAEVVTANGIIGVLFILFNLAWTQDLLLEAIKGEGSWHYPLFSFLCLAAPFVWPSVPKARADTIPADQRKVLITGVGRVSGKDPMSQHYQGWAKKWEPIRACFDRYPNLERVLIVHSAGAANIPGKASGQGNGGSAGKDAPDPEESLYSLKALLEKTVSPDLDIEEKRLTNLDDYNVLFPELRKLVNVFVAEHGYKDKEILFALTSGTSVLTAGLTFLSMAGEKGGVYSRQKKDKELSPVEKLTEFEVDVYSADELWQEIVKKADKG